MTGAGHPGEPSTTTAAGTRAHRQAWDHLQARWGADTDAEADARMGAAPGTAHALAAAGRLLAVQHQGRDLYPGYQFTGSGEPAAVLPALLHAFDEAGWDRDSVALWFTSPQGSADGAVPADLLATDPQRVLDAARSSAASTA